MMSSKSQPRPILKKSPRSPNKAYPQFFTGNESLVQDDDDEKACRMRFVDEKEKAIEQLNVENESQQDGKSCFKKSCLKSHTNKLVEQKTKSVERSKRNLSTVYILHSREIDNEIMKFLLRSFNTFIQDFKASVITELYDETQLFTTFRERFFPKLKEYLMNGEALISDQLPACNLGVTLSEPSLSDIERFRHKISQEHLVTSRSEQLFNFTKDSSLEKLNLDKNDNIIKKTAKMDNSFCGSLPTTSFFDSYNSETNLKGSVLLKSIRPKPLRSNQDSLLLAHVHEAFNKKSSRDKNIVSNATNIKKAVRFADSFGLELEKVKLISNNSFCDVFSQSFKEEDELNDSQLNESSAAQSNPFLVLIPLFSVRKLEAIIRLEDYIFDYENKIVKCVVKVKNMAYEKRVFARITVNNWKSYYDLDAIYIRSEKNLPKDKLNVQPIMYDYFGFCVLLPDKSNLPSISVDSKPYDDYTLRVEFALCSIQNGISYWDNNLGENYKFQCFYNKSN